MADKENVAPATSSDPLQRRSALSPSLKKATRNGRSKSIGPGALDEAEIPKLSAKDRRKSAFVPATKSILSKDEESARAARRKSMANRRVSFAPEATLHTWDIVMDHQEHTTSTDSDGTTRRASQFSPAQNSDAEASAQEKEDRELLESEDETTTEHTRRSSGTPPMNFNNPEDIYSSGMSGSEGESGSDDGDEEDAASEDDEGTAMSLDVDDATLASRAESDGSTGSSERLEASLQAAARLAGTRGIEYDEFGDMSMEVADDELTNAMQPWALRNGLEKIGSASLDQENINPFSPAFSECVAAQEESIAGDGTQDMSMDVTRAVGGIMKVPRFAEPQSSPRSEEDGTMDLTQAVGRITGQKRRRSTTDNGSPGAVVAPAASKRRRSSVARTSMGDDTMDLTVAVGGIQNMAMPDRRRSLRGRRSSGVVSDTSDLTMDITRAVGSIQQPTITEHGESSFAGDEELSMELTTVIGGIRNVSRSMSKDGSRPSTPQPLHDIQPLEAAKATPNGQERLKATPYVGATELLGPTLESAKKDASPGPVRRGLSPMGLSQSPRQSSNRTPLPKRPSSGRLASCSPVLDESACSKLPSLSQNPSPVRTPTSSPKRPSSSHVESQRRQSDIQHRLSSQSPRAQRQQRSSPGTLSMNSPGKSNASQDDPRTIHDTLKLITTPRKETLKHTTPKKTPAKQMSPVKPNTPRGRPTPKGSVSVLPSPVRHLHEDLERIRATGRQQENIGLQEFLTKAGIRFMDLTTTKRRLTVAPPSKTQSFSHSEMEQIGLEDGVVAAACVVPELELYQHACHELKRFTKEGKQVIAELEEQTLLEQPPLVQAYAYGSPNRKLSLDAQMRDMKTNARLRSKEMWYAWRTQLLEELMGGLSKIGEGLIRDDETLAQAEKTLDQVLPPLLEQFEYLRLEAVQLEQTASAIPEQEKEQLQATRESLAVVNVDLSGKRDSLEQLRKQVKQRDTAIEHLQESRVEFVAAIQEANRVREACRGMSIDEIVALKASVHALEDQYSWSMASASTSPGNITMIYKSDIQLFFDPRAFNNSSSVNKGHATNAPISLTYIANDKRPLSTTLRFFLQILRASLQEIPQASTRIKTLLTLVSSGWNTALQVSETERRLSIETLTTSRITGDDSLEVNAEVLLPKVRTKVRACFKLEARVEETNNDGTLGLSVAISPCVLVVYGEQYNEQNMTQYLKQSIDGYEKWDEGVRLMCDKLIARGSKGGPRK